VVKAKKLKVLDEVRKIHDWFKEKPERILVMLSIGGNLASIIGLIIAIIMLTK